MKVIDNGYVPIDAVGGELPPEFAKRFGYPMQVGSIGPEGKAVRYVICNLRFGTFGVDGNVSFVFMHDDGKTIAVAVCLAPQIGLTPEVPNHLNYVTLTTASWPATEAEVRDAIGDVTQILSLEHLVEPAMVETGFTLPVIFRGEMVQSDEDKAAGLWPHGAILCVPAAKKHIDRCLQLGHMQAVVAVAYMHANSNKKPDGVQTH